MRVVLALVIFGIPLLYEVVACKTGRLPTLSQLERMVRQHFRPPTCPHCGGYWG